MPLALYMDQNGPRAITLGLRLRNVDVAAHLVHTRLAKILAVELDVILAPE